MVGRATYPGSPSHWYQENGSFLVLGYGPDSRSHKRQKTPRENLYKLVDLSPALLVHGQGKDATGAFC